MGNGRYGFAAASEYYFGQALSSFTVADAGDAALLAGIGKSPHFYSPVPGNPGPLRRRNEILQLMVGNGYIFSDLAARAEAEPIRVAERQGSVVVLENGNPEILALAGGRLVFGDVQSS